MKIHRKRTTPLWLTKHFPYTHRKFTSPVIHFFKYRYMNADINQSTSRIESSHSHKYYSGSKSFKQQFWTVENSQDTYIPLLILRIVWELPCLEYKTQNKPRMSLFGPTSTAFQFQEVGDFHKVKPSWCLLVITKYLNDIFFKTKNKWHF